MNPPAESSLSQRGRKLATQSPMPEYILEHFARAEEGWHPEARPDGYIAMCIAENKRMGDVLLPRLAAMRSAPPDHVLGYDAMVGNLEFRQALVEFLDRSFLLRRFAPEQLAVLAGAGTVLEDVFYALADPGEGVLVPTPSYAGFWPDLENRDALQLVPVPCASEDGFRLTTARLDAALASAEVPVKALLFTNPDNPLGKVASPEEVRAIVDWSRTNGLHVVFDEIYALSVFGAEPFASVASVVPTLGDDVHIVWAFSKDFAASGLRCGVLVSENEALLRAVDGLAYWGAVSGHTQWMLRELVADAEFVDGYARSLRERLGTSYAEVTEALTEAGIPFVPAGAGIFVVCDFRQFLAEPTFEAEARLWRTLLETANVNLTPGAACHIAEPGFFRLCYAAAPPEATRAGIARIGAVVRG